MRVAVRISLARFRSRSKRFVTTALIVGTLGALAIAMGPTAFMNSLSAVATLVLVALGLTIIFGVMKIGNFAHGEFVMLGAYTAWVVTDLWTSPIAFYVALAAAAIVTALVGLLIEVSVLRRLYGRGLIPPMLATWALSIILRESVSVGFGRSLRSVPAPITSPVEMFGVTYPGYSTFLFLASLVVFIGVALLYQRTGFGAKSRAAAEDATMSEAIGIDVRRVYQVSMMLGAGLAGLAGALIAPLVSVSPVMGAIWLVKAFFVVIVGGVGTILGTLAGGNAMGWPEQAIATLVPSSNFPNLLIAQIVVFVVAGILVILRPQGLVQGVKQRSD